LPRNRTVEKADNAEVRWRRVAKGKTTIEEVVRVTQTDEVMAETTKEAELVMAG
jgi:hypothetical protein